MADSLDRDRFLRTREVLNLVGFGRTTLHNRLKAGEFPRPVKLDAGGAGTTAFLESEVRSWMQERIEERDGRA